jgi:putative CocE/NonD family hydrolase
MRTRHVVTLFGAVAGAVAVLMQPSLARGQAGGAPNVNSGGAVPSPTPVYVLKDFYDKREAMIPMRDGVRLFTIIYSPRDTSAKYPFLVTRDAYGVRPYGPDNYRPWAGAYVDFSKEGMIFVYQDVRGRWKSEGEFIHHDPIVPNPVRPNPSTDMYDTVEWLLKNVPNHNGRVSQRGVSWPGWEAAMGMINAHPAIRLSSPQAPPQDQFLGDDYHSGGAFQLAYAFGWMSQNARKRVGPTEVAEKPFDYGTPDGYRFFLNLGAAANAKKYFGDDVPTYTDFMNHGTYDEYWKARNVPQHLKGVKHPVLIVGGWHDAEDFAGVFHMFRGLEKLSPGNATHMVVGPWDHGGWGRNMGDIFWGIQYGTNTGEDFRSKVELPFFREHLKDGPPSNLPKALMFETGGNRWRRCDAWPPAGSTPTKLYLGEGGTLSIGAPAVAAGSPSGTAFDEYISDPRRPVPYTSQIIVTEGRRFTVEDQRFVATRPDVLVYESEPLVEDITFAGEAAVDLIASTTGTDSDWVVKLIDVYPDDAKDPSPNPHGLKMGGYQMLLVGDILRGKFRNSFEKPEPMKAGEPTRIAFNLPDRYHTFLKGHRIMVQVQSSWFPMFDRNPQTFVDIYHAKPGDYRAATQRIYRGGGRLSSISLPVMKGGGCTTGADNGRHP